MSRMDGAIYAPGRDPDSSGHPNNNYNNNNTGMIAPYQQQYQYPGPTYNSTGNGNTYGHGLPLYAPAPCDSRDGSALINRGVVKIEWANTGMNVPLGKLLGADPAVQNNLMTWGSDSGYRYAAPSPSPALALAPAPALSGPAFAPTGPIAPPPPPPRDDDSGDDSDPAGVDSSDDDNDNDNDDDNDDNDSDDSDDDKPIRCTGPSCTHNPRLLRDIRQIVTTAPSAVPSARLNDRGSVRGSQGGGEARSMRSGKSKNSKTSKASKASKTSKTQTKTKTSKWLCWNCCWYQFGYPAAERVWSKAKRA